MHYFTFLRRRVFLLVFLRNLFNVRSGAGRAGKELDAADKLLEDVEGGNV
jgi:hypothetical protein